MLYFKSFGCINDFGPNGMISIYNFSVTATNQSSHTVIFMMIMLETVTNHGTYIREAML